jgi:periplasmic protein CpxP/Spy
MKLKILVITTSLFMALSSTAYAEHHGNCHDRGQKWSESKHSDHFEKHQVELHEKLKLSANQEPAWKAFQTAVQPTDSKKPDFEALNKLNTLERLDRMQAFEKEHQVEHDKKTLAIRTFYTQLNTDQKKVFDENAMPKHMGKSHLRN